MINFIIRNYKNRIMVGVVGKMIVCVVNIINNNINIIRINLRKINISNSIINFIVTIIKSSVRVGSVIKLIVRIIRSNIIKSNIRRRKSVNIIRKNIRRKSQNIIII